MERTEFYKENCIKIEELKMFLGTGLQFEYENKDWFIESLMDGSNKGWIELCNYEDKCPDMQVELNSDIKPLVRPLSEFPRGVFTRDDEARLCNGCIELVSFKTIQYLASKHYDIFNWLERGLAIKLED